MIATRPINFIHCEGRALALGQLVNKEKDGGRRLIGITPHAHEDTADANLMQKVIEIHELMFSNGNNLVWIVDIRMHFAFTKAISERFQYNVVR